MPLSSAEKSKRYRDKLKQTDPERYNQMLKKSCERGLKRYREKTANLNEQEKEKLRARWREDNKKYKSSSKSDQQHKTLDGNVNSQNDETSRNGTSENAATSTSAKLAERNIQRRVERNLRNENADLRKTVMLLKKGYNNLFKKFETQQQHIAVINEKLDSLTKELSKEPEKELSANTVNGSLITINEMTPLKISEKFVQENMPNIETPRKKSVKKIILEHNVLTAALKETYETSSNEDKNKIKRIVDSTLVRKYKMKTKLTKKLGLNCSFKKHKTQKCMSNRLQSKLTAFYEQDDVSRASAGKKECKSFKGCKKQKRYLLDTLCNLHKKYIKENEYIGLSTFKKYRPFYVVTPTLKNLETCACFQHSNMQFIINALKSCCVLDTNDVNQVISKFVCDTTFKNCMYGMCGNCSENKIQEKEENSEISWLSFKLKEHEYTEKGVSKKTKKMVKDEEKGTLNELIQLFNIKIKSFKTHIFNVAHQYRQYKWCIKNLKANEIALHIDFSENWACKYKEEVQAMHFGSSKNQITLHTGVLYYKDAEKPVSFCSVCPDNTHNPEAIWAHLDPVLDYIKLHFPDVTTVHFFSDGPTTQYRQKKNFYLLSEIIPRRGFSNATWNFFEASHGKGAADGIGGAIKRTLDFKVAHGVDIPDAETAFKVLSKTETVIKLFYIAADNIKPMDINIVTKLTPLQQTMKVHQVTLLEKYMLTHRVLSCFCENREGKCKCYDPSIHKFELGFLTRDEAIETEYGLELDETSGELRKVKTPILIEENDKSDISIDDLVDFSNMEGPHKNTLNHHESPIISESTVQKDTFRKRKCDDGDQMLIKNNAEVKRFKKCQYGQESSEESNDDMSLHDTSSGEEYLDENFDELEISDQGGNYIVIPENDLHGDIGKTKDTEEYDMQDEKELTKDTYALVKFNLAKRNKFYLGQVLEVTGEYSYRIKFLRHKGKGKFAWPITDDISFIYRSDIEQIWSKPLSDRRGIKTFDLSKLTFNINQLG